MALNHDELQTIINSVLSAIQTNARSIDQLTPVTSLGDTDYFEVSGGKRVSYDVISKLVEDMISTHDDDLLTLINKNVLAKVTVDADEASAMLTVSTHGKRLSAMIPVVTRDQSGILTVADYNKLLSAYDKSTKAQLSINGINKTIDDHDKKIKDISNRTEALESLKSTVEDNDERLNRIEGLWIEVGSEEELDRMAEAGELDENKFYYVTEE
ncbi:MAG: hypothetical protein K2M59_03965 [Muribaculaceae bacterium]|nr:hypothetical protein [Muribaculaceae bacterium]MDE7465567.1 hypothetical protein [Muribaculaceae bacterium]